MVASRLPAGEPCCAKAEYRMPLPFGAFSLAIRTAPPPFAADRETLQHPEEDEQDRCPHSDLCVGGQQADADGGDAHHDQRDHQGVLAADAVAEVTEDDAADGSGEEPGPQGHERQQRRDARREFVGEEDLAEDERRRRSVDVEVVPLDGGADEGRDSGFAGLLRRLPFGGGRLHAVVLSLGVGANTGSIPCAPHHKDSQRNL